MQVARLARLVLSFPPKLNAGERAVVFEVVIGRNQPPSRCCTILLERTLLDEEWLSIKFCARVIPLPSQVGMLRFYMPLESYLAF
jgi:hypothetical protein